MLAGGNEAGDVGHVDEEKGADRLGHRRHPLEIDRSRIRRRTSNDHLWLVLVSEAFDLVVVDALVFLTHAVADDVVEATREVHRAAMGEVAAHVEAHREDGVAGLEHRRVDREVGRRAGVGLDVCVVGAKELLRAGDRDAFDRVVVDAAAVVALAGIALGVFVGEDRALGLKHGAADEVLRGDKLEALFLALVLELHELVDLGICVFDVAEMVAGHASTPATTAAAAWV